MPKRRTTSAAIMRDLGQLLGGRAFVDVRVADEQGAAGEHEVVHRGQRAAAGRLADDFVDLLQVVGEAAGNAADHAVCVALAGSSWRR
jgi:hypothetical protein